MEIPTQTTTYSYVETQTSKNKSSAKRKLKFIYGDESKSIKQQNPLNTNTTSTNGTPTTGAITPGQSSLLNDDFLFSQNRAYSHDNLHFGINKENFRIKEVEVECEIEEDPSFLESSEGYVKSLIHKIQSQYKDPETVHIKIVRRQKQTGTTNTSDKSATLSKSKRKKLTDKEFQQQQIVKKEYYTIKSMKEQSTNNRDILVSFLNTSNIPFIDEESVNSATGSLRNSRYFDATLNPTPPEPATVNYYIQEHTIEDSSGNKQKIEKPEGLKTITEQSENKSTTLIENVVVDTNEANKSGIKDFFKVIGGKITLPEVTLETAATKKRSRSKEPSVEVSEGERKTLKKDKTLEKEKKDKKKIEEIYLDMALPNIDINAKNIEEVPAVMTESVQSVDIKDFFGKIGGKLPDIKMESPAKTGGKTDTLKSTKSEKTKIVTPKLEHKTETIEKEIVVSEPESIEVGLKLPNAEIEKSEVVSTEETTHEIKDFFKSLGGKVSLPAMIVEAATKSRTDTLKSKKSEIVDTIEINTYLPNVEIESPSLVTNEIQQSESSKDIREFFKSIGGKVNLPEVIVDTSTTSIGKTDTLKSKKSEKAITVEVDTSLPNAEINVEQPSGDVTAGIKDFFKNIGGKIPDIKIESPKVQKTEIIITEPKADIELDTSLPNVEIESKVEQQPVAEETRQSTALHDFFKSIGGKVDFPNVVIGSSTKDREEYLKAKLDITEEAPVLSSEELATSEFKVESQVTAEASTGIQDFFKRIGGKVELHEVLLNSSSENKEIEKQPEESVTVPKEEIDIDLRLPNVEFEEITPKIETQTEEISPEINTGIKEFFSKIGGKLPDIKVETPIKGKTDTLRSKKSDNIEIKTPKLEHKGEQLEKESIEVDISLPNVDVEKPAVEQNENQHEIKDFFKSIGGKVNLPEVVIDTAVKGKTDTLKSKKSEKAEIITPKAETFEVDTSLPNAEINVEQPSSDVTAGIKDFFKNIGGKIPDIKIESPKVQKTEIIVTEPKADIELDTSLPNVEVEEAQNEITRQSTAVQDFFKSLGGKIELPNINVETPKKEKEIIDSKGEIDVSTNLPNAEIDMKTPEDHQAELSSDVTSGIKEFFKVIGGKIPDVKVETPKLKTKSDTLPRKIDLSSQIEVEKTEKDVSSQEIDINLPNIEIEANRDGIKEFFGKIGGKIKVPQVEVTESSQTASLKEIKTPVNSETQMQPVPEIDVNSIIPNIEIPNTEGEAKIKEFFGKIGGKISQPGEIEIKTPEIRIEAPIEINLDTSLPNVEVDLVNNEQNIDSEMKSSIKDFFGKIGGKLKAETDVETTTNQVSFEVTTPSMDTSVTEAPVIPTPEINQLKVEITPKKPSVISQISGEEINAELRANIRDFFGKIGGKIKTPELGLPEVRAEVKTPSKIKTPKLKPSKNEAERSASVNLPNTTPESKSRQQKGASGTLPIQKTSGVDVLKKRPSLDIQNVELSPSLRGGIRDFFGKIGGKIKTPEIETKTSKNKKASSKVDLNKAKSTKSLQNVDIDLKLPNVETPKQERFINVPVTVIEPSQKIVDLNIVKEPTSVETEKLMDTSLSPEQVISHEELEQKYIALDEEEQLRSNIKEIFDKIGTQIRTEGDEVERRTQEIQIQKEQDVNEIKDFFKNIGGKYRPELRSQANFDSFDVENRSSYVHHEESTSSYQQSSSRLRSVDITLPRLVGPTIELPDLDEELQKTATTTSYTTTTNRFYKEVFSSSSTNKEHEEKYFDDVKGTIQSQWGDKSTKPVEIKIEHTSAQTQTLAYTETPPSTSATPTHLSAQQGSSSEKSPSISARTSTLTATTDKKRSSSKKKSSDSPRTVALHTEPNFDGLGIHISCDADTRKSPFIHHIEANSPGSRADIRKGDYILEINGHDAINMDFDYVINQIKSHIDANDLVLTIGNEKAFKKYVKSLSGSMSRKLKLNIGSKKKKT